MINFSDLSFIFRFLPIFLIAYYGLPYRFRAIVLALGSLVFYAIGDIRNLSVFIICIAINFLISFKTAERKGAFLFLIVAFDVLMLAFFKFAFGYGQGIILPLGISFFTFKMISFQVDLYTGKIKTHPGFWNEIAYFSMFPQVTQGPIMRYEDYEKNDLISGKADMFYILRDRIKVSFERLEEGLFWFSLGFGMKILIADHLSMMWKDIGTIGYESISTPLAWAGVICYSLNLYFDFWGYSLMAAGLGVCLGFPFVQNFDHPYAARSVSEFYRRWHITLGGWFRDYVYIPLGGSKNGQKKTIINLVIVWALTGFWHGVTFNFFIWSAALLIMILVEKFVLSSKKGLMKVIGRVNVLFFIPLTWVVFAINSTRDLRNYSLRLFPVMGGGISVNPGDFVKHIGMYGIFMAAGLILLVPFVFDFIKKHKDKIAIKVLVLILFWICACIASTKAGNPFMYLSF